MLCRSERSQASGSDSHASHETGLGGTSSAAAPLSHPSGGVHRPWQSWVWGLSERQSLESQVILVLSTQHMARETVKMNFGQPASPAVPLVVNSVLHGCGVLWSLSGPSIRASHHTDLGMRPTGMGESR